jgi:putative radical SAM enzyme (TIGR03279 family)
MSGNPLPLRVPSVGGLVEAVEPGSIAAEIGLTPGDRITHVDGRELRDAIDFKYLISEESIELTVLRDDSEEVIALDKDPDEDLGVSFATATFDRITTCNNKCFFCFLKGLPKGLRKPLYLKDDDYRLSFAHGNFVTLTNLTDDDWQRLEEQRLSPLRISVHATDLALRRRLLGNPTAPDIVQQLDRLAALGIRAHTQVVVCPGVNDGPNLDETINDLAERYPTVQSIAVVPVGASLTQEDRMSAIEGMDACDPPYARAMVRQVSAHQRRLKRELGEELVYLSDEYYLTAGARLPSARRYNGYEQFENGIGMTRWLIEDFKRAKGRLNLASVPARPPRLAVLTGTLIAPTLTHLFAELNTLAAVNTMVIPVTNTLFGSRINASGLLPGNDLIRAARDLEADAVLMSRYALDWSGERFLDDVTATDLQQQIRKPVAFVTSISEVVDLLRDPAWPNRPLTIGAGPNQAGRSWTYEVDATSDLEAAPA